jgi:hypothetical protein
MADRRFNDTGEDRRFQSGGEQPGGQQPAPQGISDTLNIALVNNFPAGKTVYATLSGQALDKGNALLVLSSDGKTPIFPENPPQSSTMTPLSEDCAIKLGESGSTTTITVPRMAGGRIYFSLDKPLKFFINPGPALVEPSVSNPGEPNIDVDWGFCEFTFNTEQLYANISYVDFVSHIPVALTLETHSNKTLTVRGLKPGGMEQICAALRAQNEEDGKGWDKLIVNSNGRDLRVLSPNLACVANPGLLQNYFEPYIDEVWSHFANGEIEIDTQAAWGKVKATLNGDALSFSAPTAAAAAAPPTTDGAAPAPAPAAEPCSFTKPTTMDIFSCDSGPFKTGANEFANAIIPRLAAAFNRSTLLECRSFPEKQDLYYACHDIMNHYSRVVHEQNFEGKGYAFAYDDVQPTGGMDMSGEVHAGDPKLWTVTVGGLGGDEEEMDDDDGGEEVVEEIDEDDEILDEEEM